MQYFLAKTEPNTFSIDDLERDNSTIWDGVHNYAAINTIKLMNTGDMIFIYHSGKESKIVGLGKVISSPYKDPHDERGISWAVQVKFVEKFAEDKQVSLKQIKESGKFNDFALVKQSRLSVMKCTDKFVDFVKNLT